MEGGLYPLPPLSGQFARKSRMKRLAAFSYAHAGTARGSPGKQRYRLARSRPEIDRIRDTFEMRVTGHDFVIAGPCGGENDGVRDSRHFSFFQPALQRSQWSHPPGPPYSVPGYHQRRSGSLPHPFRWLQNTGRSPQA